MFSSRLPWSNAPNPLTELLRAMRARGEAVLDLTESNPTAAGLTFPQTAILDALADPRTLRYEPASAGLLPARQAVSEYYAGRVAPERILLTASTSEAYSLLFKLLADPGDEVLAPRPSYPLFEFLASLESVRQVQYPLVYQDGWSIDFEALEQRINPCTRAIIIVNPNNPTGSFLKKQELDQLVRLCRAHGLAIISDEVFSDFVLAEDPERVRSLAEIDDVLTFSLSGLSKVVGLPQLKLGWIVTGGPAAEHTAAIQRLELIADTYLSVGTPVQWAAARLLQMRQRIQAQILERIRENRAFLAGQLESDSPWRLLRTEGGWYAILQAPRIRTEEEWALLLLGEDRVLVQPGFFFDFATEAFLVTSLLTPPEIFREGIRRILAHGLA
jgi:alanine-synthesizing transaminase